jgi:hypothetical protein
MHFAASRAWRTTSTTARHGGAKDDASERSEPLERSESAKRLARERVRESEGRSPSE